MKTILRQDSRDLHVLNHFGGVAVIPDNFELDKGLTNPVEQAGEVDCTAISACDVATNQTGLLYSIPDLWFLTPKSNLGADPRDTMGTMIKNGLKQVGGSLDLRWKSYFRADGNSGDYALNTQMSMLSTNSPTTVASNWYANFDTVGPDGVMPQGDTRISGHDYEITGWRTTSTGLQFHVKSWLGYFMWMPKEVYNAEMNKYGTGAYIPTTTEALTQSEKTLRQWLSDLIINIGLLLNQKVLSLNTGSFPPILYSVAKEALGTHQTLNDNVPPDVGCAEACSAILAKAGVQVPPGGIAGTAALYTWLQNNPRFSQVDSPEAGDIVISATSSVGKISHGHVGIIAMYGRQYVDDYGIISNDSDTGLVREKWCLKDWINYYQVYGGLEVCYFRLR